MTTSHHARARAHGNEKAHRLLDEKADERSDKTLIKKAFSEHDAQLHGGRKTRLKLAKGGRAKGEEEIEGRDAGGRMDRPTKGKGGKGTKINILNMPGGGAGAGAAGARPVPVPVPSGRPAMPPPMPPRPATAPPPGMGAAPPPGGVPGMGPAPMPPGAMGMRKSGGRTKRADGGGVDDLNESGMLDKDKAHSRSRGGRAA